MSLILSMPQVIYLYPYMHVYQTILHLSIHVHVFLSILGAPTEASLN